MGTTHSQHRTTNNMSSHQYTGEPLPDGWIAQWSDQYNQHFFVNPHGANGPESHWIHPNEQERQAKQSSNNYAPPSGAPPSSGSQYGSDSKIGGGDAQRVSSNGGSSSYNQSQPQKKSGGLFGGIKDKLKAAQQQSGGQSQYGRPQQGYGGGYGQPGYGQQPIMGGMMLGSMMDGPDVTNNYGG